MTDNITIRSGKSFARSPDMAHFLSDEELRYLEGGWKAEWPLDILQGGVKSITAQHVLNIGPRELKKVYRPAFVEKLVEIANKENVTLD